MYVIIKEPTQGLVIWEGEYSSIEKALKAYREELGVEASDYDDVNPNWMDRLEITTAFDAPALNTD